MRTIFYKILFTLTICLTILSNCKTTKESIAISDAEKAVFNQTKGDTITISNDKTEYKILIIEPGFNTWLQTIAKPEGFYSQSYLESRNNIWVIAWNQRVAQPFRYDTSLWTA